MRWQIRLLNWLSQRWAPQRPSCAECGAKLYPVDVEAAPVWLCPNGCGGD